MPTHTDAVLIDDHGKDRSWRAVRQAGALDVIEHFNLAHVLNALGELGLATGLRTHPGGFTETDFPVERPDLLRQLFRYLRVHDVLAVHPDGGFVLSPRGRDLLSEVALAQVGFYVGAYGDIVRQIPALLSGTAVYGSDVSRDGAALANHCATLFAEYHTDTVFEALGDLEATRVLDLGCGNGQFLIDAARRSAGFTGVGIDNSAAAIEAGRRAAELAGVADRITFVVADAFAPEQWPSECLNIDVVLAVGVLHESFRDGELAVIRLLNTFADLLRGGVKAFVLGEPEIRYDRENSDSDLLLVHIFTAQGFPRAREEWLRVFAQSRLECRRVYTRANAGPRFNFFDLRLERLTAEGQC